MLPKLTDTTQTISFSEGDGVCSAEVFATDVVVTTNAGNHNHGSSKVKLRNLVDYNWEPKFYHGQLLAIHISGKYMAYSIKATNPLNPGSWSGMVRVVYTPEPGTERRTLIKGMKGVVQDLAFAHIQNQVVLACIDEQGNFYVHEIETTDGIRCTLIAEIREDTGVGGVAARVVWCPYIPDEEDTQDDDVARLLLTTHDNIARMWNMSAIVSRVEGGRGVADAAGQLLGADGALAAAEHGAAIVDAAFSPDGTALATAGQDGVVMFFQVYMRNESSPRCLHKWQPHGGKPLSCLFFLDNHKNYNTDVQFWKFAVTGAENNTIIKIWSCKSWNCLQTITFTPTLGPEGPVLGLKAMLDTSASYLVLSDFKTRSLYVLNMAWDVDDTTAYCKSIAEFLLPYPVLSFCIVDADEEQVKCESSCDDPFHANGSGGDTPDSPDDFDLNNASPEPAETRLRLYIVQPKGLQEGELVYSRARAPPAHPDAELSELSLDDKTSESPAAASSILQQQSQQLKNLLMRSQTQPGTLLQRAESPGAPPQLNLMTPDAFSSPGKRDEDEPPLSATPDAGKSRASAGAGAESTPAPRKPGSAGSSPSREVQQIMSLERDYYKHMEEKESSNTPVNDAGLDEEISPSVYQTDIFPAECLPPPAPPAPLVHSNSDTSWPQISIAQINEANQRKASSDKGLPSHSLANTSLNMTNSLANSMGTSVPALGNSSGHALSAGNLAAEPAGPALSAADRARLDSLDHKIDKLRELIQAQSHEVRALRDAVGSPRAYLDSALDEHAQRTANAVHTALHDGWERISRAGETAARAAAQAAGVGAARALEPLAVALQHELAAKLSATDQLLRDNIDKLATSKTVMERLSTSIATSLSEMVRASFRSALLDNVLPSMEKAHAQIFKQINQAFQNGAKEFASNTEAAARAAAERGGAAASAALRAALERHAAALAASSASAGVHTHHLTAQIQEITHSVLEKELSWWRDQARTVALQLSRAHTPATPASHPSTHDRGMQVAEIQSLMNRGDANGAFQLALSASDLALVVAACRACDPAIVFAPPCKLKQHVLLSLVQQLAADMTRDTHLKYRYLEEAVMNLDTANPVTREHLPVVIRELQKQLVSFLNASPAHALARQFRMLLMATESLVKAAG
ncbi:enhancer of mRNA-decapping protein 4-like [Plodia interpunctella]|uniref:enhancer of mRNA-decapping protein 4-like n=1 Tax=Plodia interpunctella TaxID=58824 RepID=UPI0023684CA8|nr:enhancer of mRNA-decapping protein 4-like [Plodia interpunctella]